MPPGPRGEVGPAVVCLIENRQVVFSVAVVFDCLHGGLEATKAPPAYGVYVEISLSDCIIKSQKIYCSYPNLPFSVSLLGLYSVSNLWLKRTEDKHPAMSAPTKKHKLLGVSYVFQKDLAMQNVPRTVYN